MSVICALEVLGPDYGLASRYFGLNLSLAIQGENATPSSLPSQWLQPWRWDVWNDGNWTSGNPGRPAVQLWHRKRNETNWTPVPTFPAMQAPFANRAALAPLMTALEGRLKALGTAATFGWNPSKTRDPQKNYGSHWPSTLIEISRYPAPIPHALNLSFVFRALAADLADASEYVAAPVIRRAGGAPYVPGDPQTPPVASGEAPRPDLMFRYATASTDPVITGHCNIGRAPEASASNPDLATLWVRTDSQALGGAYASDWQTVLPGRLAELLDPVAHLVGRFQGTLTARRLAALDGKESAQAIATGPATIGDVGVELLRHITSLGAPPTLQREFVDDLIESFAALGADPTNPAQRPGPNRAWLDSSLEGQTVRQAITSKLVEEELNTVGATWKERLRNALTPIDASLGALTILSATPSDLTQQRALDELEALHGALTRDEVLVAVLTERWRAAIGQVAAPAANRSRDDAFKLSLIRHVQERLEKLTLRPKLLDVGSRTGWSVFVDRIAVNTAPSAASSADNTQPGNTQPGTPAARPRVSALPRDLLVRSAMEAANANLDARLAAIAQRGPKLDEGDRPQLKWDPVRASDQSTVRRLLFAGAIGELSAPSATPNAVSIPVTGVQAGRAGDDRVDDPLRRLSGVVLLMKRKTAKRWDCHHTAAVFPGPPPERAAPSGTTPIVAKPVMVPRRIVFDRDLPSMLLTYDNDALVGSDPATELGLRVAKVTTPPTVRRGPDPLLHFKAAEILNNPAAAFTDPMMDWTTLTQLRFSGASEEYDYAVAAVAACGALPKELARTGFPLELRPQSDPVQPPSFAIRSLAYPRSVPLGSVRVSHGDLTSPPDERWALPAIPAGVLARARDLRGDVDVREDEPLLMLATTDATNPSTLPSTFVFAVRKPSTSFTTWARWSEGDKRFPPAVQESVIAAYFRTAAAREDTAIDDPAAADRLWVSLTPIDGGRGGRSDFVTMPVTPWSSGAKRLADMRAAATKVTVVTNLDQWPRDIPSPRKPDQPQSQVLPTWAWDEKSTQIAVYVPEGRVFALGFSAVTDRASQDRFAAEFRPAAAQQRDVESRGWPRLTPRDSYFVWPELRLLIEVATRDITVKPDQVFAALQIQQDANTRALIATITADASAGSDADRQFRNVGRAEIVEQMWRWDGRSAELPFVEGERLPFWRALPTTGAGERAAWDRLRKWCVQGFAGRPYDDAVSHEMRAQGSPRQFVRRFPFESDPRALVVRFGVRVHNRYAACFRSPRVIESWVPIDALPDIGWKHVVVPCSFSEDVPQTSVRIALPLTRAADDAAAADVRPALLIVTDGGWYDKAGLAEQAIVELQTVKEMQRYRFKLAPQLTIVDANNTVVSDIKSILQQRVVVSPAVAATSPLPGTQFRPNDPVTNIRVYRKDTPVGAQELQGTFVGYDEVRKEIALLREADEWYQFGADPVIQLKAGIKSSSVVRLATEGPIGHSADQGSMRKRFNAASFIVPLPEHLVDEDLWPMGQIRMRRRLVGTAFVSGSARDSNWSPPYWVQWMPPIERIDDRLGMAQGKRVLLVDNGVLTLQIHPKKGSPLTFQAPQGRGGLFRHVLLVSRAIHDIAGRHQERYTGIAVPSSLPGQWRMLPGTSVPDDHVVARILELQIASNVTSNDFMQSEGCFWATLFPDTDTSSPDVDVRARVVGMSRPYRKIISEVKP